jgi:signal transduction histidine kinase
MQRKIRQPLYNLASNDMKQMELSNTIKAKQLAMSNAMEAKQLELSTFDCISRLQLYQNDPLKGKLADQFESLLTGIAHDLKSPISIATSILEILANEDKQRIKFLNKIWLQLLFIKWIADNFLGISLSEKPGQGSFLLVKLVHNVLNLISDRVPKNIKINLQIQSNLEIKSDEMILKLALVNLLMNSLESMRGKPGEITISSLEKNGKTIISVSDTGESIPDNFVTRLFNFGFTTKDGHLGNGLYVSKRLLYQIHAELNFRSDYLPHEKIFEIIMPTWHEESMITSEQNAELQISLKNLHSHLSTFRDKILSQGEQELLQAEFHRQTSIFTNRLTQELLIAEKMVRDVVLGLRHKDAEFADSLKKIEKNCAYCRLLTRNILEIGGGISLTLTSVSLIEVVQEVLSLVDRKMPKDLYSVEFEVAPMVDDIDADALQLMQVFMNLIRNALDAMPRGGQLGIEIDQFQDKVFARVRDTGIGILPENLPKLFTMGFSTKSSGYGIGLYSVKNIIEKHQGTIEVNSKVGRGTAFTVLFPKHQTS